MKRLILPAGVPSLLVHNLDRYPPESEHEEDQTCENGGEEAFHDSYGWYSLMRWLELRSLQRVGRQTHQQSRQGRVYQEIQEADHHDHEYPRHTDDNAEG